MNYTQKANFYGFFVKVFAAIYSGLVIKWINAPFYIWGVWILLHLAIILAEVSRFMAFKNGEIK